MSRLVLGIDEAGRGPALGPMVLAAVALEPAASRRLTRAGVTDSKAFGAGEKAHRVRRQLVRLIESVADFVGYEICDVASVDEHVRRGELNVLERARALLLIERAPPAHRIVADGERLFSALREQHSHLEAHNGGEGIHVAVAAASVCAKARRDELFAVIAARYAQDFGPVHGGGYVNAATRGFTGAYTKRFRALPPEARASWPWQGPWKSKDPPQVRVDTENAAPK